MAAFINQGGVRSGIEAGPITYGQAISVMPFNNTLTILDVTGAELRGGPPARRPFARPRRAAHSLGGDLVQRQGRRRAGDGRGLAAWTRRRRTESTLLGFTANGGDSHFALRDAKGRRVDTGLLDIDALVTAYLKARSPLDRKAEGRVVVE